MVSYLGKRCRRNSTVFYLVLAIALVLVWHLMKPIARKVGVNFPQETVLIAQRGHSNIPDSIFMKHLYNKTEALRIQALKQVGVFASIKPGKPGQVNVHLWFDLCGTDLRTLLYFPCFPNVPSSRLLFSSLNIINIGKRYGKRVFGFIVAPESTGYLFRFKASGSAEFWISSDRKIRNCRKILQISPQRNPEFLTTQILMELKKSSLYYFEILHKHGGAQKEDFVNLEWKFGERTGFQEISSAYLRGYLDDFHIAGDVVIPKTFPPPSLNIHRKNITTQRTKTDNDVYNRDEIYRLSFIPEKVTKHLFPKCPYRPSYILKHKLERYDSKWKSIYSSIYPSDNSNLTKANGFISFGNDILEESKALNVVDMVKKQFKRKGLREYKFKKIINIEHKRGRYLTELQFFDVNTKKNLRFSEYLYLPEDSSSLCYPEGFKWNKTSMVHFIVTTGHNQARWVNHFINNMEKIYKETKEINFNVIINDYLSPHADLVHALERSSLPHYMLLISTGRFQRSIGLQQAANAITDPNGIVVTLDLHLEIPSSFIDDVRKHTILGVQAYSPILERMECGTNAEVRMGSYWEFHGYGIVGIYKKDWEKFGGMNVKEFYNWGGEDIEMNDRILMSGYETDRKKIVGLLHYFHARKGMWS